MELVDEIKDYVATAYREWQLDCECDTQAVTSDCQRWLDDLSQNPENRDPRQEWLAFAERWSDRITIDPDSYHSFEEWLVEHIEHGCCCDDERNAVEARDEHHEPESNSDHRVGARWLIRPGSKFSASDVVLALQVAQAIQTRWNRIARLQNEIDSINSWFRYLFVLPLPGYNSYRLRQCRAEIETLFAEIFQLERDFLRAGLDNIEFGGRFGDDWQWFGGKGLAGAEDIIRGIDYDHVGLESVFVNDVLLVTGLAELSAALATRAIKSAGGAVGRRLMQRTERQTVSEIPEAGHSSAGTTLRSVEDNLAGRLRKRELGNLFNRVRTPKYEHNNIYVANPSGGYYILDSYNEQAGEIVSRKLTQLAEIEHKNAIAYIREVVRKYHPGTRIADVPSNGVLRGAKLQGNMFLEVPIQVKRVPEVVLDAARSAKVTIRDVNGKVLN